MVELVDTLRLKRGVPRDLGVRVPLPVLPACGSGWLRKSYKFPGLVQIQAGGLSVGV